jgi:hypothetical protein
MKENKKISIGEAMALLFTGINKINNDDNRRDGLILDFYLLENTLKQKRVYDDKALMQIKKNLQKKATELNQTISDLL